MSDIIEKIRKYPSNCEYCNKFKHDLLNKGLFVALNNIKYECQGINEIKKIIEINWTRYDK